MMDRASIFSKIGIARLDLHVNIMVNIGRTNLIPRIIQILVFLLTNIVPAKPSYLDNNKKHRSRP
jgi:hypothetical protein